MTDVRLEQFAELLATANEEQRLALFSRAKLLAMNMADPEVFEPPIETLGDYLARDIPVPPILIEPALVVRGGITCTIGRAGKGKTQFNLNRILRAAAGLQMFEGVKTPPDKKNPNGRLVLHSPEPLKILVIENEGSAGMFHEQLTTMVGASGYLTNEQRELVKENVLIWGDGGYSGLKLDDPQKLGEVRAGCEKWNPDIVFIEPFRGLWQGDENSSTDMAIVADALSAIASDFDCGVVLTHHERKSGSGEDGEKMSAGRGSTVLEGVVAVMENFESVKDGEFREVSWSKIRYGGGVKLFPVRMEWQAEDFWYKHVPQDERDRVILEALASTDEPMSIRDLKEETDESENDLRKALKDLAAAGQVKKMPSIHTGSGSSGNRYRLAVATASEDEMEF